MITVTEIRYLDGIGDALKDVEYPKFDDFTLGVGGDLTIYKSHSNPELAPVETVVYVAGSFRRVHKS